LISYSIISNGKKKKAVVADRKLTEERLRFFGRTVIPRKKRKSEEASAPLDAGKKNGPVGWQGRMRRIEVACWEEETWTTLWN